MAIEKCVNEDVLKDFLSSHGSEVFNMLLTEFNMEDALQVSKEEGIEEGREHERYNLAVSLLDVLDDETISAKTRYTVEEIQEMRANN